MSLFIVVSIAAILMNSTLQVEIEDENLVKEFRDLVSQFLQKPSQESRSSKYIRDISKTGKKEAIHGRIQMKQKPVVERETDRPKLSPLYSCTYLDLPARLCVIKRQLGTTLTLGVEVQAKDKEKYTVHWYRVYKVRGQTEEKSLSFVKFSRGNLPWNINIGGDDNELRISPITDVDFGYNFFLATLSEKGADEGMQEKDSGHGQRMMFRIEPININMGPLYHGEEISINVRSYMELPAQSVRYEWSRMTKDFEPRQNLPSNMKLSRDGSTLIIKEHQSYVDMTLTCAVYSNKNFTLGRRNFYLRKIELIKKPDRKVRAGRRRKKRYLDDFYAEPLWNMDRAFKTKRDSSEEEDTETEVYAEEPTTVDPNLSSSQTSSFDDFPDTNDQVSSTGSEILEKPHETAFEFHKSSSESPFMSVTEEFQDGDNRMALDGLIKQANSLVEYSDDEQAEEYSTVKLVAAQKPTFEDSESMLIADCNEDADCGINAVCFHIGRGQKFCKCLPHYRGNGMFCWLF